MASGLHSTYGGMAVWIAFAVFLCCALFWAGAAYLTARRFPSTPRRHVFIVIMCTLSSLCLLLLLPSLMTLQLINWWVPTFLALFFPSPIIAFVGSVLLDSTRQYTHWFAWSPVQNGANSQVQLKGEVSDADPFDNVVSVEMQKMEKDIDIRHRSTGNIYGDEDEDDDDNVAAVEENDYYSKERKCSQLSPVTCPGFIDLEKDHKLLAVIYIACILLTILFSFLLYGGCMCGHPYTFSTWSSRSLSASPCGAGVCHTYFMLGENCSSMNMIVHWTGSSLLSSSINVCEVKQGTVGGGNSTTCVPIFPPLATRIQHQLHLSEDRRSLLHVAIGDLHGDTLYQVSGVLVDDGGLSSDFSEHVRTLPCGMGHNISFLAGGDYQTSYMGERMLEVGQAYLNGSARFMYIGGDLAYANNLRYCYRRWDTFLSQVSLRQQDGSVLPILTAVGNHEGGGYRQATNYRERSQFIYFYMRYFPAIADRAFLSSTTTTTTPTVAAVREVEPFYVNNDDTSTFHRHIIGGTGWVVLDSGIISSVHSQVGYLQDTLDMYRSLIDAGQLHKIIVTYHNPAFPTVRSFHDTYSTAVRETFVPLMDAAFPDVAWVLENHDHAYKRTYPLLDGEKQFPGAGIVYSGDGALGVHSISRKFLPSWYQEIAQEGNYILAGILLGGEVDRSRATVMTAALDEKSALIDYFVV